MGYMCHAELQAKNPELWHDFSKVALVSETLRPYWSILGEQPPVAADPEVHKGSMKDGIGADID
jgi:hypothetical protein